MKKYRIKNFTLIELLAAMAVFSILLMISIRLFSGAQNLWLRSEQKTAAFANARVAMEFMASRLQSNIYSEYVPFYIVNTNDSDRVWFASRMQEANSISNHLGGRRFFQFSLVDPRDTGKNDAGNLQLRIFKGRNASKKFRWIFPPYNNDNRYFKTPAAAFEEVDEMLTDNNTGTTKDVIVDIIENVIGFNLVWYNRIQDASGNWKLDKVVTGNQKTPPYLVEIEIMLIDTKENFRSWQGFKDVTGDDDTVKAAKKKKRDEIFSEFGYTFRRAILLGEK